MGEILSFKKSAYLFLVFILILAALSLAVDDDGDLLDDAWEFKYFGNLSYTSLDDPDGDLLRNIDEYKIGANPKKNDTDSDGFTDYVESFHGANATNPLILPKESANKITLINPKYGTSPIKAFDLKVSTQNSSVCKRSTSSTDKYDNIVSTSQIFTKSSDGKTHTSAVTINEVIETKIYIYCKTDKGYANDLFPKEVALSVDSTPIKILSAAADPSPVIETLKVDLITKTDDKSVCKYLTEEYSGDLFVLFNDVKIENFSLETKRTYDQTSNPRIEDRKTYTFFTYCMNKAEKFATSVITFDVDLSVLNQVTEILPEKYARTTNPEIKLVTNKDSTCKYGEGYLNEFSPRDAKIHYLQLNNLSDGNEYVLEYLCIFKDLSTIEDEIVFTVDTKIPTAPLINAESETCSVIKLNASYSSTDNVGISKYVVKLLDSSNNVLSRNITDKTSFTVERAFERGKQYFWEVYAIDEATNNGTKAKTLGTTILLDTSEKCKGNKDPYLNITSVLTENGAIIGMICKDDDGSCVNTQYSFLNSSCTSCGTCPYQKYSAKFTVTKDAQVCYSITDSKNKTIKGMYNITFEKCTGQNCCLNKTIELCLNNCTRNPVLDCHPENIDSDKDGMKDFVELDCGLNPFNVSDTSADNDGDTISNEDECLTYKTDMNSRDTDMDGFDDNLEVEDNTSPVDSSSFPIDETLDTDGDGITDLKEEDCGLDKDDPDDAKEDKDGDSLSNKDECLKHKTSISKEDTDNDGYSDDLEIKKGTNPNKASDFPKSYTLNIILIILGLALLGGGVFLYLKNTKKKEKPLSFSSAKPATFNATKSQPFSSPLGQAKKEFKLDFGKAKKEIDQPKAAYTQPVMSTGPDFKPFAKKGENLDMEIKKKREEIKLKQMSSIFDEFATQQQKSEKNEVKVEKIQPAYQVSGQKKKVKKEEMDNNKIFNRLDDISEEDAFEEIEKIRKRERK